MIGSNRMVVALPSLDSEYILRIPEVRLGTKPEPALEWNYYGGESQAASLKLLKDFVKLADVDAKDAAERVLVFAREWGPLRIQGRGNEQSTTIPGQIGYLNKDSGSWRASEPIWAWQFHARRAKAIQDILKAIDDRTTVKAEVWPIALGMQQTIVAVDPSIRIVEQEYPEGSRPYTRGFTQRIDVTTTGTKGEDLSRKGAAFLISQWLQSLPLFPSLTWEGDTGQMLLLGRGSAESASLFAHLCVDHQQVNLQVLANMPAKEREVIGVYHAIGLLLAYVACGKPDTMWCDHGGHYYQRGKERRPKPGQQNYCPDCREDAHRATCRIAKAAERQAAKQQKERPE